MKRIFIAGLTLLLAGCASYSKHPDFIERHKKIYTAAVVPADVEVYKLNFKGNKDLMNELIPKVENFSQDKVESVFEEKGYYVQKLKLDKEILEKNPNLKTALLNAKNLFNQKIKSIEKGKKKKFTYSLGSDVNYFANMADADVLVFIKQTGYKKTGAKIARDIGKSLLYGASTIALGSLVNVSISEEKSGSIYPNKASIQVAVVDSNTGDILWYNSVTDNPRVDLTNEKSTRSFLGALFTSFPNRIAQERQVKQINLIKEVENYRNLIIERIKTQLPQNFTPLNQPVWIHMSLLKTGSVKELSILKEKSNSDEEIQRVALESVDKALPMPAFPEEISDNELSLDIPITN